MSVIAGYYAFTLAELTKRLADNDYIPTYTAECNIDRSYYPLHIMLTGGAEAPIKGNIFSLGISGWYKGYENEYPELDCTRWDTWGGEGFLNQAQVKEVAQAFLEVDIASKVYDTRAFSTQSLIWHFDNLKDFYHKSAKNDCFVEMLFL